ncbi:MAG TPA: GAF domain-containing protein [Polyangiaceae bacterium]|nr:GAF domain-containing protein [Polyangiaceae bacterium]
MLAPLEPIELLFERLHEPSDDSPILYRERAYLVDALQSDTDLEEHLEAELSRIRRDWRHRDASQFVQLSLYDHRFQGDQPSFPPIATLSWKDWQGRSEIWVRGVRRSTLPPGIPLDSIPPVPRPGRPTAAERRAIAGARTSSPPNIPDLPVFEPTEAELEAMNEPVTESSDGFVDEARHDADDPDAAFASAADSLAPESALHDSPASSEHVAGVEASTPGDESVERNAGGETSEGDAAPDSGPGWQSPDRSGEFPIPVQDEASAAPSSQRVLASEELIGNLFERLHELAFVATLGAGADCLLAGLAEAIPCDGALIHVLDVEAEEFVVMRALGAEPVEVLGRRTRGPDTPLSECLRRKATLELSQSDIARQRAIWQTLGVLPRHVIASPVHRHNQPLGVIELCRTTSKGPFSAAQISALEYACEQFAEFAGERPMELARASLEPPTPL